MSKYEELVDRRSEKPSKNALRQKVLLLEWLGKGRKRVLDVGFNGEKQMSLGFFWLNVVAAVGESKEAMKES